ncbi:MAG: membrane dipeptidase, partial [Clostridia bacterium]|nr:membrane dipeptidase [Clostridia bacterium]
VFGLVHNGRNELACGGATDNGRGLTETGKDAVRRCEELGIVPDCSHLSDAGFDDLVNICKKPFIATHSNCRSIYDKLRNLTDDQLKEIFRRKGIVGLNLFPDIICDDPHITDLLKHAEKMLELGGEDCIAMGGDLDGIVSVPRDFKDVSSYTDIRKMFADAFSDEIAEKIMYKNAARFFGAE